MGKVDQGRRDQCKRIGLPRRASLCACRERLRGSFLPVKATRGPPARGGASRTRSKSWLPRLTLSRCGLTHTVPGRPQRLEFASAFGAVGTWTAGSPRSSLALLTHCGHKPAPNPAAQQSPGVLSCVLSLRSEAREASDSETARVHHAARRRGRRGRVPNEGWLVLLRVGGQHSGHRQDESQSQPQ
jgi:hypothetical protein